MFILASDLNTHSNSVPNQLKTFLNFLHLMLKEQL